ncbi:hypothetical protein [Candidatus Avelusimicrobium faecicola]
MAGTVQPFLFSYFHYEEVKPYTYTHNKQTYKGIFKCNHSIV